MRPFQSEAPRGLHAVLFFCSLLTTAYAGTELLPRFAGEGPIAHARALLASPSLLLQGLPFALTLLFILAFHEWGHFSQARRFSVHASWPYFIPGPPYLSVGTFGAFIRLRGIVPDRNALILIGAGGPLAGFAAATVAYLAGHLLLALGYSCPTDLGVNVNLPLACRILEGCLSGRWDGQMLLFANPVIAAAWIGFFVQGLNLLPCGQLDGGHVLYAFTKRRHRLVSRILGVGLFALIPWGFHFAVWGALLLLLGYGHPACREEDVPMQPGPALVGWVSAVLLLLCFHPLPFHWG